MHCLKGFFFVLSFFNISFLGLFLILSIIDIFYIRFVSLKNFKKSCSLNVDIAKCNSKSILLEKELINLYEKTDYKKIDLNNTSEQFRLNNNINVVKIADHTISVKKDNKIKKKILKKEN